MLSAGEEELTVPDGGANESSTDVDGSASELVDEAESG